MAAVQLRTVIPLAIIRSSVIALLYGTIQGVELATKGKRQFGWRRSRTSSPHTATGKRERHCRRIRYLTSPIHFIPSCPEKEIPLSARWSASDGVVTKNCFIRTRDAHLRS